MNVALRARVVLALCAALLAGCVADPVASSRAPIAALDRELAALADDPRRPLASLSALAIRHGAIVYEGHFGRRFLGDAHGAGALPADAETLYRVASISKLVTTLGVMRLVEQGRLALDTDIGTYLGYPVRNPSFPGIPVTLRMLLAHTSSMRDGAGYYTWDERTHMRDVLLPGGAQHGDGAMWSREHAPGTYFSYCNLAWGVVGTVMEKVTGERFDLLMARLVLEPLGMRGGFHTAGLAPPQLAHLATLYRKRPAGESDDWDPQGPWIAQVDDHSAAPPTPRAGAAYVPGTNGTLFAPQGGLRASVRDLGRVMRMLIDRGMLEGQRFLAAESVDAMLAQQWRHDGANGEARDGSHRARFNAWGLGTQRFLDLSGPDYGDRLAAGGALRGVGHLADAYGLRGTFAFDPASGDGIVFLVGGTGFNPETDRGAYSAAAGFEERIATALHRRAIEGRAD